MERRGEGRAPTVRRWAVALVFALCSLAPMGARATGAQAAVSSASHNTFSPPVPNQNITGPTPPGESQFLGPSGFERTINALQNSGTQVAMRALKIGNQLLWLLLVIAIAWFGIQVMLGVEASSFETAVGGFVSQIFIWGLIAWLMRDYSQITNAITSGFTWLSTDLTGGNTSASKVMQTAGYLLPGIHLLHMTAVLIESIKELPWFVGSILNPSFFTNLLSSVEAAVVILIIWLLMMAAAVIYIGIAMLSMLLVSIAIAVGPIFIPFFMLEFTSFLFNGWFRFLLVAAAWRLIGGVVISIVEQFMKATALAGGSTSILVRTGTHPAVYNVSWLAAFGDILVVVVIVFVMLEIPNIASQIVNGAPNISMRTMGGFAKGFSREKD